MAQHSISIVGCGWLGLPLAERFVQKNYEVKGSTTSINKIHTLAEKKIEPYLLILNPVVRTENVEQLLNSEILVLNIPPKRGRENVVEFHNIQIRSLLTEIIDSKIKKVIFVSSTSVYGNKNGVVTEESELDPERNSGKALVEAENMISENAAFDSVILRFGGLVGPDRHPGKFFPGKKNIPGGKDKVNLIHRDDCIDIIEKIIDDDVWNETFNACAPEHPTRKELYTKAAEELGFEPPEFENDSTSYKIVDPAKLIKKLNYTFNYPDPLKMF